MLNSQFCRVFLASVYLHNAKANIFAPGISPRYRRVTFNWRREGRKEGRGRGCNRPSAKPDVD